jgi:outer membrane protein TolC
MPVRRLLVTLVFAFLSQAPASVARADDSAAPTLSVPAPAAEGLTLGRAIRLALLNNRSLEKATLDRETQLFDLRVAEDEFFPDLNLFSSATHNPVSTPSSTRTSRTARATAELNQRLPTGGRVALLWENDGLETRPGATPTDYDSALSLRLDQPLLRGAGTRTATANLRIARLSEEVNVLEFRRIVIDTVTRVVFGYRALLQAKLQLEVAESALQRAREQLRVNRALVEAGILPPVEIIQTEADIASQDFNVLTARAALDSARFNLVKLLDIDRDAALDPVDGIDLPEFALTLEQARDFAFRNRPDYLQAEQNLAIAGIGSDVARNNMLWNLSLAGRYRLDGNDSTLGDAIDQALRRDNEDWSLGLTLAVPLGDLTRRQAMIRARNRALKAAIDLVEVRENIEIEIRDAFRTIDLGLQRVRVAVVARELAERKLEIEKGRLQTGRTTNFAIVTFQNDLVRARLNEINAQIAYLNAISGLDLVLGTTLETWGIRLEQLDAGRQTSSTRTPTPSAPATP